MAVATGWHDDRVRIAGLSLAVPAGWPSRVDDDRRRAMVMEPVEEPLLILGAAEQLPTNGEDDQGSGDNTDGDVPDVGRYLATLLGVMTDPTLLDVAETEMAGLPGGRILATHRAGPGTVALDMVLVNHDDLDVTVQVTGPLARRPEISGLLDEIVQRSRVETDA